MTWYMRRVVRFRHGYQARAASCQAPGNPRHTSRTTTVASFRTWRGLRPPVARSPRPDKHPSYHGLHRKLFPCKAWGGAKANSGFGRWRCRGTRPHDETGVASFRGGFVWLDMRSLLAPLVLCAAPSLEAQLSFRIDGHPVQVHGFASQGFAYSGQNNYLTMKSSHGSFALTDVGVNASFQLTDRFHVGAQVYTRNIGHLGDWHPQLDWA